MGLASGLKMELPNRAILLEAFYAGKSEFMKPESCVFLHEEFNFSERFFITLEHLAIVF